MLLLLCLEKTSLEKVRMNVVIVEKVPKIVIWKEAVFFTWPVHSSCRFVGMI